MLTCGGCGKELKSSPDCLVCASYRALPAQLEATQRAMEKGKFLGPPKLPFAVNEEGDVAIRGIGAADVLPADEDPDDLQALGDHVYACEVCTKAVRLRFTDATTDEIHERRCPEGRRLAEIAFRDL